MSIIIGYANDYANGTRPTAMWIQRKLAKLEYIWNVRVSIALPLRLMMGKAVLLTRPCRLGKAGFYYTFSRYLNIILRYTFNTINREYL